LLQRRILLLSFRRMAGRRSGVHGDKLLQRRILLLSFGRMAGRRSGVHGDK
jgi:hypothetical protein